MEVIRAAGMHERLCINRTALNLYGSIITFGRYGPRSEANDRFEGQIIQALKECIIHHPLLAMITHDVNTKQPKLAQTSEIDLADHLRILDLPDDSTKSLEGLLESIHNDALPSSDVRPQWRLYAAKNKNNATDIWFAFACSHNCFDGRSGAIFHRTFLRALRTVSSNKHSTDPHFTLPSPRKPFPLPSEQISTLPISWSFFLKLLSNEFLPARLNTFLGLRPSNADSTWRGAGARPEFPQSGEHIQTTLRIVALSAETTSRILQICKAHGSKLTGLLTHTFARVLAQALQARGQEYRDFKAQMPLDLRRALAASFPAKETGGKVRELEATMANYVSEYSEIVSVDTEQTNGASFAGQLQTPDWQAIRSTTEKLAAASSTLADQPLATLKYVLDVRGWLLQRAGKPAGGSFEVSNLGVFSGDGGDDENGDAWRVKEFGFSQSADATGAVLCFNVGSAKAGGLRIVVSWWAGMLGVGDEGGFVDDVCRMTKEQLEGLENVA